MLNNPSLQDYLCDLEAKFPEEILHLNSVSKDYLPSAIAFELQKKNETPVIVINNPDGKKIPLVTNLFASKKRVKRLLEKFIGQKNLLLIDPIEVKEAPVKKNIRFANDIDLDIFPIGYHFKGDGGKYITGGFVVAKDPDTGVCNLSYHRLQIKTNGKIGLHMSKTHLWDYFQRAEKKGQDLEAAIVIGAHPTIMAGAAAKVAISVDEYRIAGGLLGMPVELVCSETINVPIPATAEIVIEGKILADIREPEGPFSEYSGYVSNRSSEHVFQITGMTWRDNPVFVSVVAGNSSDHLNLARSIKEQFITMRLQEIFPEVEALFYPDYGTSFQCFIQFVKSQEGRTFQAMSHLLGLDQNVRIVACFDPDIKLVDPVEVMWALATRVRIDKDIVQLPPMFCTQLDPCAENDLGAKIMIDATMPLSWDIKRCKLPQAAVEKAHKIITSVINRDNTLK